MDKVVVFSKTGSLFNDDNMDWIGIMSRDDKTVDASFPVNVEDYSFPMFNRPRAGDINQDGFADILMTFTNGKGTIPILFLN